LAAVTLLYYEAALIVSQTNPVLSKRLRGLPNNDLCQFSVLDASALGDSFASVVAGGDRGRLPEIKARWLPAPNLLASFAHLAGGVRNSRPGCPPGITAKYLVSFESVVAGVLMANASLCDDLQVVATEEELRDWDAGWVLTAAAHNGGTALPPSIAATVRRHKVSVDRRLLEEKHKEGGVPQGGHLLASACGGTVGPRVRASQLVMPLALSVFVPTTITAVLAVVYPLLLGVLGRGRGAGGGRRQRAADGRGGIVDGWEDEGGGVGGLPPWTPPPGSVRGRVGWRRKLRRGRFGRRLRGGNGRGGSGSGSSRDHDSDPDDSGGEAGGNHGVAAVTRSAG